MAVGSEKDRQPAWEAGACRGQSAFDPRRPILEPEVRHGGGRYHNQGLTVVIEAEGSTPDLQNLLVLNSNRSTPNSLHQIVSLGISPNVNGSSWPKGRSRRGRRMNRFRRRSFQWIHRAPLRSIRRDSRSNIHARNCGVWATDAEVIAFASRPVWPTVDLMFPAAGGRLFWPSPT